jgi:hypothetical protein
MSPTSASVTSPARAQGVSSFQSCRTARCSRIAWWLPKSSTAEVGRPYSPSGSRAASRLRLEQRLARLDDLGPALAGVEGRR